MSSSPTRPEPSDADSRFDRVVERWFRDRLRLHPELATRIGVHEHDDRLSPASSEAVEEQVAFHRSAVDEMERFSASELSAERALDRDLLIHEARVTLHELTEQPRWERRSGAADSLGDAIFPLLTRDFAPVEERIAAIAGRLEAAPRMIAERRARVTRAVRVWAEIDLQSGEALAGFLDTVVSVARSEVRDAGLLRRLEAAAAGAKGALADHGDWLRSEVIPSADGEWRLGAEAFEELVRLRELDADADAILAVGEEALAEARAEREQIAREIDPTLDPEEVRLAIKQRHPTTFAAALDEYRNAIDRARRFVAERDLATFPPDDNLQVLETPPFLRHTTPFAAYFEPAKLDPVPVGMYIVTPPSNPEMLREHSYASISNTSVHEAYPGHHLQLSAAIVNPSLVRTIVSATDRAAEFAEGWAFYCERIMKRAGFDDTPEHRFMQNVDVIWRATRIVLDVRLHRREMAFDEAVEFLIDQTGFERPAGVAEVKRYTSTPTYQLSYLYGRHMIETLRTEVERRQGSRFTLKRFHDTLLYGGMMPVSYARRLFPELRGTDPGPAPEA